MSKKSESSFILLAFTLAAGSLIAVSVLLMNQIPSKLFQALSP